MQKEYAYNQNSIVNANINIYNKILEINELYSIVKSLENNISSFENSLEIKRFNKIKKYYEQKINMLKIETKLLGLYINRKEAYAYINKKKTRYKTKKLLTIQK